MDRALFFIVGLVYLQLVTTQLLQENVADADASNINHFLIQDTLAPCISLGASSSLEGTCMHEPDCDYSKGTISGRGNCSAMNICCTYTKTCNQAVKSRIVYFENPAKSRQFSPCTISLKTVNENICQIRVDIEHMDTQPPVLRYPTEAESPRDCDEYLTIYPIPSILIPQICGRIVNNHFYIHLVGCEESRRIVNISMILQTAGITTTTGTWRIKLTQLECPGRFNVYRHDLNPNQAAADFKQLAPDGCLQYYTQPVGTIKNFGYISPTASTMPTPQDYAACIKRPLRSCGIRYKYTYINLGPAPCMKDYIYIPENLEMTTIHMPMQVEMVCDPAVMGMTTTSSHPGPQYIHVNIDGDLIAPAMNEGFNLMYDATLATCP